jgi:hypothetical protein
MRIAAGASPAINGRGRHSPSHALGMYYLAGAQLGMRRSRVFAALMKTQKVRSYSPRESIDTVFTSSHIVRVPIDTRLTSLRSVVMRVSSIGAIACCIVILQPPENPTTHLTLRFRRRSFKSCGAITQ